MSVIEEGSALKRAIIWASEARTEHPEKKTLALVDEAGMRFNLSPKESDALLHLLKGEDADR